MNEAARPAATVTRRYSRASPAIAAPPSPRSNRRCTRLVQPFADRQVLRRRTQRGVVNDAAARTKLHWPVRFLSTIGKMLLPPSEHRCILIRSRLPAAGRNPAPCPFRFVRSKCACRPQQGGGSHVSYSEACQTGRVGKHRGLGRHVGLRLAERCPRHEDRGRRHRRAHWAEHPLYATARPRFRRARSQRSAQSDHHRRAAWQGCRRHGSL